MKRGISLIAVLMFMLAATTASVVLYKWIGSENFASGSRLKHSEAYQASESGLDAVYAWLSYKAPDVGSVIGDYLKQPQTIQLTAAVGNSQNDKKYRVYLTEVGADKTNKTFKLKFLSIGEGRDNSRVAQEAVYNIEGLYKMKVPKELKIIVSKPNEFDEQLWGNPGVINTLEVNKAVLTQSPSIKDQGQSQALNTIKVKADEKGKKGYVVLDGNYYTNAGINVDGDLYVTGSFDFCPNSSTGDYITGDVYVEGEFHPKGTIRIDGDAYLKGGMNPNRNLNDAQNLTGGCTGQASGGVVAIGGNTTLENNFFYYNNGSGGGLGFSVAKNLVMNAGQIDLSRTSGNSSDSLAVNGDVCIQNAIKGSIPNTDTKPKPYFGKTPTSSSVNIPGTWTSKGSKTFANSSVANLEIRSDLSSIASTSAGLCSSTNWKNKGADPMDGTKSDKDYKKKLKDVVNPKSCEKTPIQFNGKIYEDAKKTANTAPTWVHKADKPGSCSVENGKMVLAKSDKWVDLGEELQNCWNAIQKANKQSTELYEGEWLVVYIRNKTFFSEGNGKLTSGKYIIINEIYPSSMANSVCTERNGYDCTNAGKCSVTDYSTGCPPNELPLPPTAKDVSVMLYLPLGFPNKIKLGGTQLGTGYNYFIFSDYDISNFDTGKDKKLRGNIFMNKCSLLNSGLSSSQNPYLNMERNPTLVGELMKDPFKILCDNENFKNDRCLGGGGGGGGGGSTGELKLQEDNYIIPIGPRLKVELESKSLSKKDASSNKQATPSVLVMPRVLNLPKDAFKNNALRSYYNFIYLNGKQKITPDPTLKCELELRDANNVVIATATIDNPNNKGSVIADDKLGVYTCSFPNNSEISPFFLKIQGETGMPKITLTADKVQVEAGKCTNIHINADNTSENDMIVTLNPMPQDHGWDIDSYEITIPAGSMEKSVKVCHRSGSSVTIEAYCTSTDYCGTGVPDNTVTIGIESSTLVHRDTVKTGTHNGINITQLRNCPTTSGKWTLAPNCTPQQTATSGHNDSWKCRAGEIVTLSPPGDNSCEVVPSNVILSGTATNDKTFTASYKWKQHDLTISGDLTNITLTPADGSAAVNCNTKCYLYNGLQYSFTVPANYVARLNGIDVSDSLKVKVTQNNNTLRITTNTNSSACYYDPFWCNNFPEKGGDVPNYVNKKCFFARDITTFCSSYSNSKINGVSVGQGLINCWGGNKTLAQLDITKKDGGYYILAGDGTGEIPTFEGNIGKSYISDCPEKTPSNISCSISGTYYSGIPVNMPTITGCSGTNTPREFLVYNVYSRDYDAGRWKTSSDYAFNNTGDNRAVTLSQITCNGTTSTFDPPILCGHISISPNPYSPWCRVKGTSNGSNKCYTGTGSPVKANVEPPEYGCGPGSSVGNVTNTSNLSFRYTKANNGDVDSDSPSDDWKNNRNHSISARDNSKIFMYAITCDGNAMTKGSPTNTTGNGWPCEGSFSIVTNSSQCSQSTTFNLTCNPINTTVTAGTAITPPQVQCSGTGVPSSDLEWDDFAPNWSSPDVGTYNRIGVSATGGNCVGKTASCSGTITVNAPPCQYVPADCGGIAKGSVIATAQNITNVNNGGSGNSKCYFATDVIKAVGNNVIKVNGQTISDCGKTDWGQPLCSTKLSGISKRDGGYYIFSDNYVNFLETSNTYSGLNPGCR